MKFLTTRKEIMSEMPTVIEVGYSALDTLLKYQQPIAYTRNRYGWRNNIYILEARRSAAIVTGYAPFGNIHPYELTKEYEAKAAEIENGTAEEMNKLLIEYIDKVIEFRKFTLIGKNSL